MAIAAAAMVALGVSQAGAATYGWTISGSGYTGSGTLTTGVTGYNNPWPCGTCVTVGDAIATFSGTLNGQAVSLLPTQDTPDFPGPGITPGVGGFAGNDNLIYPTAPYLDWGDIGFAAGGQDYNVFNGNYTGRPGDWLPATNNDPGGIYSNPVVFTLSVPEPATWAMMLLGVGMIGGGLRVSRRKDASALTAA